MFKADLAEIGRASTRTEAIGRATAYQERTRSRVRELITTIGQSGTVALDPTYLPTPFAGDVKPPTKAMIAFATSIAAQCGLKLPCGLKSNSAICRAFLDQHVPSRSFKQGEAPQTGPRSPSEAMVRYARSLAEQHAIECPPEVITDFTACRAFLDEHAPKAQYPQAKNRTVSPKGRLPAVRAGNGSDGHKRVPASARRPTETRSEIPRRRTRSRTVASGRDD